MSDFSVRRRVLVKAVLLGNCGVGKTSVMEQFVFKRHNRNYRTTIGADFLSREIVFEDMLVTTMVWDTAGQERFQSLGPAFYRGADVCILVFDVNDIRSFQALDRWREGFLANAAPAHPASFPIIVLGNKIDVDGQRQVSAKRAQAWCDAQGTPGSTKYFEVSAREAINVDEALTTAALHGLRHGPMATVNSDSLVKLRTLRLAGTVGGGRGDDGDDSSHPSKHCKGMMCTIS